jgi:hypothetical protein
LRECSLSNILRGKLVAKKSAPEKAAWNGKIFCIRRIFFKTYSQPNPAEISSYPNGILTNSAAPNIQFSMLQQKNAAILLYTCLLAYVKESKVEEIAIYYSSQMGTIHKHADSKL